MLNSYKFLFSEKNLEELNHDEICAVIKHVRDNMLKTTLNEKEKNEEFPNNLYSRLLDQCNSVGALIGVPTEEDEKEENGKESIIYLFKKEGTQLNFLSFEDDQFTLTNGFPISLLFKKMIHLVESPDKECLMKGLETSEFKIKQTFDTSFNWLPKGEDKTFSFIGTSLGQTWTFLVDGKDVFFLSPNVDTQSGGIFWEKTCFVPLAFFLEKDFILFYEGKKDLGKDISDIIVLQKKIFDLFSDYRLFKSTFNRAKEPSEVIQ